MKILVRFGDNDFATVMRAFGDLLLHRVQAGDPLTPERVAGWFNEIAPTLYEMVQCAGRDYGDTPESLARTRAYLQIKPADVYVDAAMDEKMETAHQWSNGDSVVVDGSKYVRERVYTV